MVGDLLLLPPIKAPQIFEPYDNGFDDFFNLWWLFVMAELTEPMQQKGDEDFVNIFNNIPIDECSEENAKQFQMIRIPIQNVHLDATLLLAENYPEDDYIASKIAQLNYLEMKIESTGVFPDSTPMHLQTSLCSRSSGTTAGLSSLLKLEKIVRIMITSKS